MKKLKIILSTIAILGIVFATGQYYAQCPEPEQTDCTQQLETARQETKDTLIQVIINEIKTKGHVDLQGIEADGKKGTLRLHPEFIPNK